MHWFWVLLEVFVNCYYWLHWSWSSCFGVFCVFLGVSAVSIFDVGVARMLNFALVSASPARLYMLLSEQELLRLVSLVAPEM